MGVEVEGPHDRVHLALADREPGVDEHQPLGEGVGRHDVEPLDPVEVDLALGVGRAALEVPPGPDLHQVLLLDLRKGRIADPEQPVGEVEPVGPELVKEVRLQGHGRPVRPDHLPLALLRAVHLALVGLQVEHDDPVRHQEQAVDLAVGEQEVRGEVDRAREVRALHDLAELPQLLELVPEAGA